MNGGTEMDVMGKLVELIFDSLCRHVDKSCKLAENIADDLISGVVTVQEWIPVDDRMPDSCGFPCLLCGENSFGQMRVFEGFTGYMERGKFEWHINQKDIDIDVWTITHWMPMPKPPKGE